jgi:hypothetical protein
MIDWHACVPNCSKDWCGRAPICLIDLSCCALKCLIDCSAHALKRCGIDRKTYWFIIQCPDGVVQAWLRESWGEEVHSCAHNRAGGDQGYVEGEGWGKAQLWREWWVQGMLLSWFMWAHAKVGVWCVGRNPSCLIDWNGCVRSKVGGLVSGARPKWLDWVEKGACSKLLILFFFWLEKGASLKGGFVISSFFLRTSSWGMIDFIRSQGYT